jgi:hypothetical protein
MNDPATANGPSASSSEMESRSQDAGADGSVVRRSKIATVSHTLDATVAHRLRYFAFRERFSESAVIEFALRELFDGADDAVLGGRLRDAGAALRRKA